MSQNLTMDEFIIEKVIGHRSQALPRLRPLTPWLFDVTQRTKEDYTPYFKRNMAVCLELEYNGTDQTGDWRTELNDERDMIFKYYYDCTLNYNGREFVIKAIQGLSSEEFAARLPLNVFRKHFTTSSHCSMHSHSILFPYEGHQPIPSVIALNAWQLYKAYYPAWIYIFGNYPNKMIRSTWGLWKHKYTNSNPISWDDNSLDSGSGITFARCDFHGDNTVTNWDVEIRSTDSTQELDQIIACRALSKALFADAAKLSNMGRLILPEDREHTAVELAEDISLHFPDSTLEERQGEVMKRIAFDFYREVKNYLTPFEKQNVRSCLLRPVRHRGVVFD